MSGVKSSIKEFARTVLPVPLYKFMVFLLHLLHAFNKVKETYIISRMPKMHLKSLQKVKGKRKIRCVFFALDKAIWKYDAVYQLMAKHSLFDPVILVCPIVNYGTDNMLRNMEECYALYKEKGYNVIKSYDVHSGKYLDVKEEINPDIIFYTNPYHGLIDERYYIANYLDILSVYVPYGFNNACAWDMIYNQLMNNVVWRMYVESDTHKEYARKFSRNQGRNAVVTGYPGIDCFIDPSYEIKVTNWKLEDEKYKKIIWAPHHTIEPVGIIDFSNFLKYCDFMLNMAMNFKDDVQFVFKPHPLLRNKLNILWGDKKTSEYYNKWETLFNTNSVDGDYIDLFLTSDAMIHDSASFLIEYLYVGKPVMRMMNDVEPESVLNGFALDCLDVYYKGYNEEDIEQFVHNVINGIDPMKEARDKHLKECLLPRNGITPSENIIADIIDSIDNQILYR